VQSSPHLAQVAFSVTDLERTFAFYRDLLGFLPAGGTEAFRGPLASVVQGLPEAASICWWLVDQREFMQLEMFEFESPPVRPLPDDWRPCDIGYTAVGLHVRELDGVLERLAAAGVRPVAPAAGPAGARRACVRDPEGVLLELVEEDPLGPLSAAPARHEVPVVARRVTVSVPDLAKAERFWVDTLGLVPADRVAPDGAERDALRGLPGARCDGLLCRAGDFEVELLQYHEPRGRARPDGYRISDQGILNVALGFREIEPWRELYERILRNGYTSNCDPVQLGPGGVVYCNDDQGFSVELLCCPPEMDADFGFTPGATPTRSR
jgi:catechol 2,3-dioxygenase-like lactoylglutathione lyase family enzyme